MRITITCVLRKPRLVQVLACAAGGVHSLAVTDNFEVYSTGVNDEGALGRKTGRRSLITLQNYGSIIQRLFMSPGMHAIFKLGSISLLCHYQCSVLICQGKVVLPSSSILLKSRKICCTYLRIVCTFICPLLSSSFKFPSAKAIDTAADNKLWEQQGADLGKGLQAATDTMWEIVPVPSSHGKPLDVSAGKRLCLLATPESHSVYKLKLPAAL